MESERFSLKKRDRTRGRRAVWEKKIGDYVRINHTKHWIIGKMVVKQGLGYQQCIEKDLPSPRSAHYEPRLVHVCQCHCHWQPTGSGTGSENLNVKRK
jgi:hypothetical protein